MDFSYYILYYGIKAYKVDKIILYKNMVLWLGYLMLYKTFINKIYKFNFIVASLFL